MQTKSLQQTNQPTTINNKQIYTNTTAITIPQVLMMHLMHTMPIMPKPNEGAQLCLQFFVYCGSCGLFGFGYVSDNLPAVYMFAFTCICEPEMLCCSCELQMQCVSPVSLVRLKCFALLL